MEEVKIWAVNGPSDVVPLETRDRVDTESLLEETLVNSPQMLLPGLRLVGRQTPTEGGPLGRVPTLRSASNMSANRMKPRKSTSSLSKREKMRLKPFNRRNSRSTWDVAPLVQLLVVFPWGDSGRELGPTRRQREQIPTPMRVGASRCPHMHGPSPQPGSLAGAQGG